MARGESRGRRHLCGAVPMPVILTPLLPGTRCATCLWGLGPLEKLGSVRLGTCVGALLQTAVTVPLSGTPFYLAAGRGGRRRRAVSASGRPVGPTGRRQRGCSGKAVWAKACPRKTRRGHAAQPMHAERDKHTIIHTHTHALSQTHTRQIIMYCTETTKPRPSAHIQERPVQPQAPPVPEPWCQPSLFW